LACGSFRSQDFFGTDAYFALQRQWDEEDAQRQARAKEIERNLLVGRFDMGLEESEREEEEEEEEEQEEEEEEEEEEVQPPVRRESSEDLTFKQLLVMSRPKMKVWCEIDHH
jgi:hypothetical protein